MRQNKPLPKPFRNILLILVIGGLFFAVTGIPLAGRAQEAALTQAPSPTPTTAVAPTPQPGVPVEVGGRVLFYVRSRVGSLTPAERAAIISQRINDLATNPFAPPVEISITESSEGTDVMSGDQVLLTVTDSDAQAVGMTRQQVAQLVASKIQAAIEAARLENTPRARLIRYSQAVVFLLILVGLFILITWVYKRLLAVIDHDVELKRGLFASGKLLQSETIVRDLKIILNGLRWIIFILIIILALPYELKLFPATRKIAEQLINLVRIPLTAFWSFLVNNQSNFMTLAIIIVVTYLLIRLVKFFFREIGNGTIRIGGFDPDWASFTSNITSFLLVILAIIIGYPFLPGSDSAAFKGISVFLGLLFTLSSTAAVTNIVAGIIQTYTGAFKVGDVIKIGLVTGIVTEKRLLTTRVQTFKNEDVSIPNGTVLNTDVTNYTSMAKGTGVIFYTTITIGYDAPWKQIHELLVAAALVTPEIEPDPAPFVLQTSLNDFNVAYQVNCYTKHPEHMARIYSNLHQNIQDQFNQAGVEIMSPTYSALRDGNTVTIPPDYRPEGYQTPGFHVSRD